MVVHNQYFNLMQMSGTKIVAHFMTNRKLHTIYLRSSSCAELCQQHQYQGGLSTLVHISGQSTKPSQIKEKLQREDVIQKRRGDAILCPFIDNDLQYTSPCCFLAQFKQVDWQSITYCDPIYVFIVGRQVSVLYVCIAAIRNCKGVQIPIFCVVLMLILENVQGMII